jgi:hypothetical protein
MDDILEPDDRDEIKRIFKKNNRLSQIAKIYDPL